MPVPYLQIKTLKGYMMKVCSKCGIKKEFSEFHKCKKSKDGYKSACKFCRNKENKEYTNKNKEKIKRYRDKYKADNKEKLAIYNKKYYEENKEHCLSVRQNWKENNPELRKKHNQEWDKNNREKRKNISRRYRSKNTKKVSQLFKNWSIQNQDKISSKRMKYRSTKLKCTPPWYEIQKEEIIAIYKKAQELTKSTGTLHHVDHIYPLKPRKEIDPIGLHVLANLQILTEKENLRKNNMQPEEWEKYKL